MKSAEYWIEKLGMEGHEEGGYYRESYRSAEDIPGEVLPEGFGEGVRQYGTSIYFLLKQGQFSAMHRLQADEVWHFHAGGPLGLYILHPEGRMETRYLGLDPEAGHFPQQVVPRGCWFGVRPLPGSPYSLSGCTMAPGFDFRDFEMGDRGKLIAEYPGWKDLILEMTYGAK